MYAAGQMRSMPSLLPFAMAIAVFAFAIAFSFTSLMQVYPELAVATAYDLVLSAPVFYYLAIRKTRIPKITVTAVFSLGLVSAHFLLPPAAEVHVGYILTTIVPAVELSIAAYIGFKAHKGFKAYKASRGKSSDLRLVLREVCDEVIGKSILSRAVAFEISIFAYAFLPFRELKSEGRAFSYFKTRGTNPVYGIIAFVIAAETFVMHFILARWSNLAAWIITASSLYVGIMLLAHFRAIRKRPIEVFKDSVVIRCGLFSEASIRFKDIESIEPTTMLIYGEKDVYHASLLKGFEDMNVLITLKREKRAAGPYWTHKKFKRIAFFVDQKDEFLELISKS